MASMTRSRVSNNSVNLSREEGGNGCRWLRFEYQHCWCRQRASLKIVADSRRDSYGMLYFVCEKKGTAGGCKFFRWCYPKSSERGCNWAEDEVDDEVDSENNGGRDSGAVIGGGSRVRETFMFCVACCSFVVALAALVISLLNLLN